MGISEVSVFLQGKKQQTAAVKVRQGEFPTVSNPISVIFPLNADKRVPHLTHTSHAISYYINMD